MRRYQRAQKQNISGISASGRSYSTASRSQEDCDITLRNMEIILFHLEMCNRESKINRWIKPNYGLIIVVINSQSHRGLRATQCPIRYRFKYSWGTSGAEFLTLSPFVCFEIFPLFTESDIEAAPSAGCFCQHKVCLQLFKSGSDSQPLMWLRLW